MFDQALDRITAGFGTESGRAGVAIVQGRQSWSGMVTARGPQPARGEKYLLYSVTKSIVAAATLRMSGRGGLALDVPVGRWLKSPASVGRFTLRQLLGHTSGLPDYGALPEYQAGVRAGGPPWSRADYLRQTRAERLLFQPGQGWAYSNIGYMLVKDVLEQATGLPLATVLRREVFAPLGIVDASVPVRRQDLRDYQFGPSGQLSGGDVATEYHPGWIATGVVGSTPMAAALALHGLMTGELLPPELLAQMCLARPVGEPIRGLPWQAPGYGLGLMVETAAGAIAMIGHTGDGPGCSPAVYHFPGAAAPTTICVVTDSEDAGQVERMVVAAAACMTGAPVAQL